MERFLDIALIITSVTLIISVILQSKGAGLGGLTGADTGGVYTARRGIERTLFWVTIVLSVIFFALAIASLLIRLVEFHRWKGRFRPRFCFAVTGQAFLFLCL